MLFYFILSVEFWKYKKVKNIKGNFYLFLKSVVVIVFFFLLELEKEIYYKYID